MRLRVPLFTVWLAVSGAAGCGELRSQLGDGGADGAGAPADRAAPDLRAQGEAAADTVAADVPAGGGDAAADLGSDVPVGGGDAAADLGTDVPAGGGDAAADLGTDVPVGGGDGRADVRTDAAPDAPADAASDAPADVASDTGGGALNGTRCGTGLECASRLCVDGFCCNASCEGQCEACDVAMLEGACAPVAGDPHGTRRRCDGTGMCAGRCGGTVRTACTFPGTSTVCRAQSCTGNMKTQAAGCDGLGACPPVVTMACSQGCAGNDCLGACTGDPDCAMTGQGRPYCDAGTCTALKPNGRTCSAATECTSGRCADGYCCNTDCAAQCMSCREPGSPGTCIPVVGNPRTGGVPARVACGGVDVCAGQCDGSASACRFPTSSTGCGSPSCTGGNFIPVGGCDGAGYCQQGPGPCPTGYCDSATSCGPCPSDAACDTGRWCDGGTCRAKRASGQPCTAAVQCASDNCETNADGSGGVCCAGDCTGTTPLCSADGAACVCDSASCGGDLCYQGSCCTPNVCEGCLTISCYRGCGLPDEPPNCPFPGACCGPSDSCTFEICL